MKLIATIACILIVWKAGQFLSLLCRKIEWEESGPDRDQAGDNSPEPETKSPGKNVWLSRKLFIVSGEQVEQHRRRKKMWYCQLCDHVFTAGDVARWIYCNSTPGQTTGNFFVCSRCDCGDEITMAKAKENLDLAIKLAKRWGIFGPDWERDIVRHLERNTIDDERKL